MLSSRSRLATQLPRHCRAYAQACGVPTFGAEASLAPVRYHIFKTPLAYPLGSELQNGVVQERSRRRREGEGGKTDILFLLEHTPTYTTGRRDNTPNPDELHPEEKKVVNVGASFHITKRGGQVTYHGPGQIVGYPILDSNEMNTPTRCYVEYLQASSAEYVRDFGSSVDAPHEDGHVGVFNGRNEKLASIGIHLSHRITSHGFAMNITPEPVSWFDSVVACGSDDVRAVSSHQLLQRLPTPPPHSPSVQDVSEALVPRFQSTFQRQFLPLSADATRDGEGADLEFMRRIVQDTERKAEEYVKEQGGWPTKPDTSRPQPA